MAKNMPSILQVLILYQLGILFCSSWEYFQLQVTIFNISSLKNTWFIFLMLKRIWQLGLIWWLWFLAAFIPFFWPCPHSCKISLSAPSSVFVLKAKEWKEKMVPVTSVPFYRKAKPSKISNRFLLLFPLLSVTYHPRLQGRLRNQLLHFFRLCSRAGGGKRTLRKRVGLSSQQ